MFHCVKQWAVSDEGPSGMAGRMRRHEDCMQLTAQIDRICTRSMCEGLCPRAILDMVAKIHVTACSLMAVC
jgi:hypothetical protein